MSSSSSSSSSSSASPGKSSQMLEDSSDKKENNQPEAKRQKVDNKSKKAPSTTSPSADKLNIDKEDEKQKNGLPSAAAPSFPETFNINTLSQLIPQYRAHESSFSEPWIGALANALNLYGTMHHRRPVEMPYTEARIKKLGNSVEEVIDRELCATVDCSGEENFIKKALMHGKPVISLSFVVMYHLLLIGMDAQVKVKGLRLTFFFLHNLWAQIKTLFLRRYVWLLLSTRSRDRS